MTDNTMVKKDDIVDCAFLFVENELASLKKALENHETTSPVNYRAIAYGALQFTIGLFPDQYDLLAAFWDKKLDEFNALIYPKRGV